MTEQAVLASRAAFLLSAALLCASSTMGTISPTGSISRFDEAAQERALWGDALRRGESVSATAVPSLRSNLKSYSYDLFSGERVAAGV